MTNKVLIPVVLGVSFGLAFLLVFLFVHRLRTRRRHSVNEVQNAKRLSSTDKATNLSSKVFRSKSTIRNEIPQFVIPGTHIKLVQPVIIPPEQPQRKISSVRRPTEEELEDAARLGDDEEFRPRMLTQPSSFSRGGSFIDGTGRGRYTQKLSTISQRSTSAGVLFPGIDNPVDYEEESLSSPVTSPSPKSKRKSHSRTTSVSSIDLLSINVPPSSHHATKALTTEGDGDNSSRQSPEESPRLFKLFRQSKHQIKLTGATVEFSLQYEIGKRSLMLNVMRVRRVSIPADRKHDAKICLSIHLKPDKFIWEAKTKVVQGQENPMFGEMFTISGFSLSKLHDCALLFRLQDINVSQIIGEVTYSLRDLQPDVLTSRTCQLQRPIGIIKDKDRSFVGDLLVSMDYDPTNWKLNVRIIRARGLPKMSRGGHTDSFVKINVHQDLERVFKRKTRVQRHEWNPEYDEGFDFELTREQMDVTSITMNVVHRGKIRDHLIGVVLVGLNLDSNETGYQHWAMMLDKPNLSIEQWHKIYPVLK